MTSDDVYTRGKSFRARAEARQREYRQRVLEAGRGRYGHLLDDEAAARGGNFLTPAAFEAARARQATGKGVAARTFENMLSSQAMCFNLFAPLARDLDLASRVMAVVVPGLGDVGGITIEYTPAPDVFGDQTGREGVDCDVLVEAKVEGEPAVLVVETKFVEPEFSVCGYRRSGHKAPCPVDVVLDERCSQCLYAVRRGYRYWDRTWDVDSLKREALPAHGCAFAGPLWQLWVNHTLAHVEARRRGASRAHFAVLAPSANTALKAKQRVTELQGLVRDPGTVLFLDLDRVIEATGTIGDDDEGRSWHRGLAERYAGI